MTKLFKTFYFGLLATSLLLASQAQAFTILAFGDSITQGYQRAAGAGSPYSCGSLVLGNSTTSCGYINELTAKLRNNGTPSGVYNWGWAGEAVTFNNVNYHYSSGVQRFYDLLRITADANVDFVLIHEGTNDLSSRSAGAIANGLETMVTHSLSRGITPILATITPRTDGRTSASRHLDLNRRIVAIANKYKIPLADMYSALGGFSGFYRYHSGDALHINDFGYDAMANEWLKAIEDAERAAEEARKRKIASLLPAIYLILEDE